MRYRDRDRMRRMILKGLRDGLPIGLGYFAVAFSLGINARGAGISPLQGWVASILNHASAGEYALYALIGAHAAAWEIAAVIFVTAPGYDYEAMKQNAKKANDITNTLTHILEGLPTDCSVCALKGICDEVEGMKELHFGVGDKGADKGHGH